MSKSSVLNFTQNLNYVSTQFNSSDNYGVAQVSVTSSGNNLTTGTRTFTAAGGSSVSGGNGPTTFTVSAVGVTGSANVAGPISITNSGQYLTANGPTATNNAATVDTGSTNATFALTVGIVKTLYTASANDSVIKSISVTSTDTAARIMTIYTQDSSNVVNYIASVNIPLGSGTASGTTAAVDMLSGLLIPGLPYDSNGKRVLPLKAGTKLIASVPAVTASTIISVNVMAEEY